MKRTYKIFRAIFVSVIAIAILLPAAIYVLMALPPIQNTIKNIAETELQKVLDTEVEIGSVTITPYNKVTLRNILINDANGDTAAYIKRLGAGIDLQQLIADHNIVINYTELIGLDARINKTEPNAPYNIQNIIYALKPKEKNKPPTRFDLRINTVIIRNSQIAYDILSEPRDSDKLDRNHLLISDFNTDMRLPHIANDDFSIEIKRFAFKEQSGLELSDLIGKFHITSAGSAVNDMEIKLPNSQISIEDIAVNYDSWDSLKKNLNSTHLDFRILPGSYISPADFGGLLPALKPLDARLNTEIALSGTIDSLNVSSIDLLTEDNRMHMQCRGNIKNILHRDSMNFDVPLVKISGYGSDVADLITYMGKLSSKGQRTLTNLGKIDVSFNASGSLKKAKLGGAITTSEGKTDIDVRYAQSSPATPIHLEGKVSTNNINIGEIIENNNIGAVTAYIEFNTSIRNRQINGVVNGVVDQFAFKGYEYRGLQAFVEMAGTSYNGTAAIADENLHITIAGDADFSNKIPAVDMHIDARDIALDRLNLWNKYPGHRLSASVHAEYNGKDFDNAIASLAVNELKFVNSDNNGIKIENIYIDADNQSVPQHIDINSDVIDGYIEGSYSSKTLLSSIKDIASHAFPAIISEECHQDENVRPTDFQYQFTIKDNNQLTQFVNAPVRVIHPIKINGNVSHSQHKMNLKIDIPFLQQKNKLIKNSLLAIDVDSRNDKCQLFATTLMPTKKGYAEVNLLCNGSNDRLDTRVDWNIKRNTRFDGELLLSTLFKKDTENRLGAEIDINPSQLVFNDTAWTVEHARVIVADSTVSVSGFNAHRADQYIKIDGKASANPDDMLTLQLLDVNLDYIFETLAIPNVMFGGDATGSFYATHLLTREPRMWTPELFVKDFSYNYAVLGDTKIESQWDQAQRAVTLDAVVNQPNKRISYINGAIFPLDERLDLHFKTDKVNVGFMQPFMAAFAKDVSGYASGDAHLYGTFKLIDMTGDIYAEDLKLKIDFTNTTYTATDSVHLRPGNIEFENIEIADIYGNKAKLSGRLKHYYFKRPEFNFRVHDANNLLCYDETEKRSPIWYGRIFGNGHATVDGRPGFVGITVNMRTQPSSTFSFVLSDALVANEYKFITFRDRNRLVKNDDGTVVEKEIPVDLETKLLQRIASDQAQESKPTQYKLDITADINENADMILVMDPVGGDRIKARGNGIVQLVYNSESEDLFMSGKYVLDEGKYNFTLQDIIIKEFSIKKDSKIEFNGDPYAANLDIAATYRLNANLSDLDESFLQDKDLKNTNVPVDAVINVSGDMRQPDIAFDLKFPTLKDDVERKVYSIISTEDMMSRQIIYLLALNRFYTPEYMASTTKGNELMSVASSTISSQLSSILGELSENWSISPNFRSDKGDFSDVEVDLALSSRLLNNRLLFNGNFGYRDKSMNNNTFIGDFDIEYLLNQSGNIRLKAYNRYNDQNYYARTALTTQGVGIVFKRDFDNLFSFLRPKKKETEAANDSISAELPADSIAALPDSIAIPERDRQTIRK